MPSAWGSTSIQAMCADASKALPANLAGPYDRILVDAPCSGLGTLRSHPEIKWQRDDSDIARLCALQARILQSVAQHLKTGGVLVYSTCTLTVDENEQVVENFLRENSQFELTDAARYLPESARHMVRDKYFQALPQRDDTDGFFAARMRKVDLDASDENRSVDFVGGFQPIERRDPGGGSGRRRLDSCRCYGRPLRAQYHHRPGGGRVGAQGYDNHRRCSSHDHRPRQVRAGIHQSRRRLGVDPSRYLHRSQHYIEKNSRARRQAIDRGQSRCAARQCRRLLWR